MQHVGHHAHRLLGWLGGLAAVTILVAAATIWRLLQGPVELDRLAPYVEAALQRSGAGLGVALSGVSIAIDGETHQLDLRVRDVRLSLPGGERLARLPEVVASFSAGALLAGRLEPTRIVVERPTVALRRDASGALSLRIGDPAATDDRMTLDGALALFGPPRPGAPWSRLRRIAVRDATIVVDDRPSGRVWRADRAAATLERSIAGAAGDLSVAIAVGSSSPELHATYRVDAATQRLDLQLAADGVDPVALAPLAPALAPLAQAEFPVSGTLGLRVDLAAGRAEGGRLDLAFGEGAIATDLLAGGRLAVARGELHADYDPGRAELRLERLAFDLHGGTTVTLGGRLDGLQPQLFGRAATPPAPLDGALDISLSHVPVGRAGALWPRAVSPGGRRWVMDNIPEGTVDELAVQLGVAVDPTTLGVAFGEPHGTIRFHDLTVDYFAGLPPARKVAGTATIGDRRIDFTVTGGAIKSLKTTSGSMSIVDIGAPVETLSVDVGIAGPLQDALEVIDSKPLRYAHDAGIDPARVGGKVDAQVHFKLPLLAELKLDAVDYGAKATLSGASYGKIAFDRNLTDATLTLALGRTGAHVEGGGRFDATPATFDGNLYFHPKSGPRIRYRVGMTLDDEARARLGWDMGDRLAGPVGVDLTYTVPAGGQHSTVAALVDLTAASLACDEAGWKKPAGVPGTARLNAELDDDAIVGEPQIEIKAPGLDTRFGVALDRDTRSVERVDIRRLALADSDVAGTVTRRPGGGWRADIRGPRLDLGRQVKHALDDDTPDNPAPLAIEAHIGRLLLGPHREAHEVSASLLRERGQWQSVRVDSRLGPGQQHRLALSLGGQRLHAESDDLGAVLSLFGLADNVVGGHLAVDGTLADVDGHRTLRAHLEGSGFSLVRAPALARLLSLASLDGLTSMMTGSGIPFQTLRADFALAHRRVSLSRLIVYGGALGITAKGWLDPGTDRIDIDGTLAPAYTLNSVLGNFPVIGSVLMGGEGQGLFAASFKVLGSSADPTVTVNPLSALTPGLLRHLFDPFLGTAEAEPLPPPPAAPPGPDPAGKSSP
ncbi:MAG TPA: AsmA-like C-terminal region-containing protein [Stellaceae bacterium]|nr:AsmA-like C-terminal region-containing protein [Stellaceae bacterium]